MAGGFAIPIPAPLVGMAIAGGTPSPTGRTRYFGIVNLWPPFAEGYTSPLGMTVSYKHDTITQMDGSRVDVMDLDLSGTISGGLTVSREQSITSGVDLIELDVAGA